MPETRALLDLLRRRRTTQRFDPQARLDEAEIRDLIADACTAPSSFNIQHWRFVGVRTDEDRDRLRECAYGQQQVRDAAVTLIVLGDLRGLEHLPEITRRAVEAGAMPAGKAEAWIRMAGSIYSDDGLARDEALRSGSLAAMVLMLAAEARGWASGALIGFDAPRLRGEFGISSRYLPVMLVAVGPALDDDSPRQPRLSVDEVLSFDRASFDD